jgi:AraC-like DNA-binding protein
MDFSNLVNGLTNAYTVGKEVSRELAELFERRNSFSILSKEEYAKIEEMKVNMRDANVPLAWEATGEGVGDGYFCIFNESFLKSGDRNSMLADTPLLNISKERIYFIEEENLDSIRALYAKMQMELQSDYAGKSDILRCYVHLLTHEAMKVQNISNYVPHKNAGQRTSELFLALLERQFPIEIPTKTLELKTANDYADRLSVHVNHLNRVVKSTTGRTTTALITNRIIQESVQLLQHSNHSIGEIAFALGFEEIASFSNFIKRHTELTPTAHRSPQTV